MKQTESLFPLMVPILLAQGGRSGTDERGLVVVDIPYIERWLCPKLARVLSLDCAAATPMVSEKTSQQVHLCTRLHNAMWGWRLRDQKTQYDRRYVSVLLNQGCHGFHTTEPSLQPLTGER